MVSCIASEVHTSIQGRVSELIQILLFTVLPAYIIGYGLKHIHSCVSVCPVLVAPHVVIVWMHPVHSDSPHVP